MHCCNHKEKAYLQSFASYIWDSSKPRHNLITNALLDVNAGRKLGKSPIIRYRQWTAEDSETICLHIKKAKKLRRLSAWIPCLSTSKTGLSTTLTKTGLQSWPGLLQVYKCIIGCQTNWKNRQLQGQRSVKTPRNYYLLTDYWRRQRSHNAAPTMKWEHRTQGKEMLPMLAVGWWASAVRGEEVRCFRNVASWRVHLGCGWSTFRGRLTG